MVDEYDTPSILNELTRRNTASAEKRSERRKRNALRRVLIILLVLAPLLFRLLALTYQTWRLNLRVQRVVEENSILEASLEAAEARIAALEEAAANAPVEQSARTQ